MNVLLVEDDLIAQMGVRKIVTKTNQKVHLSVANNGQEAIDFLDSQQNPDLVMLDLNMPVMGGIEFLRNVRLNQRWSDLVVVVLTTSDYEEEVRKCWDMGIQGYFVKDIDYGKHVENVKTIVNYWSESKKFTTI